MPARLSHLRTDQYKLSLAHILLGARRNWTSTRSCLSRFNVLSHAKHLLCLILLTYYLGVSGNWLGQHGNAQPYYGALVWTLTVLVDIAVLDWNRLAQLKPLSLRNRPVKHRPAYYDSILYAADCACNWRLHIYGMVCYT